MKVRLKFWRGDHGPGDVIELLEHEAAVLFHHGTAEPAEDAEPGPAPAPSAAAPAVVKGAAVLESATGAADSAP